MATVTGFQLRDAIRRWEFRRDTLVAQFNGSLSRFEGDTGPDPTTLAEEINAAENAIATLQAAQLVYNTRATASRPDGLTISLADAIKRIGGAARIEKMWRTAVTTLSGNHAHAQLYRSMERNKDMLVAVATVTVAEALNRATKAASVTAHLRHAVAVANATPLSMPIDESLLVED